MGLKELGQAARVVQRAVHGAEQRKIAQLGTTVNVALRKDFSDHHHCFSAQVAINKMMSCFECQKDLAQSKVPLFDLIS
jgi:hypothetical protein